MAYYIFLKSLRSLEEFRKNPHVKIPPKSSSTIFQSLAKFKNPILIRKSFYFFSLLSAQPACPSPTRPWPAGRPKPPPATLAHWLHSRSARASLAYFAKYVFFLISCLPSAASSLSAADTWAPPVSSFCPTAPADRATATPAAPPHPAPLAPRLGYR